MGVGSGDGSTLGVAGSCDGVVPGGCDVDTVGVGGSSSGRSSSGIFGAIRFLKSSRSVVSTPKFAIDRLGTNESLYRYLIESTPEVEFNVMIIASSCVRIVKSRGAQLSSCLEG